ncbi:unnamed protein product [Gongylonema pulchrum]|uniref:Uncharacterized protein n=1 Tax=Gongylonema pulchrum TaxID=637853 RepID=A0A183EPQ4_9BILA|nr:unnamed protein product [Gongylonema pulchrum]
MSLQLVIAPRVAAVRANFIAPPMPSKLEETLFALQHHCAEDSDIQTQLRLLVTAEERLIFFTEKPVERRVLEVFLHVQISNQNLRQMSSVQDIIATLS